MNIAQSRDMERNARLQCMLYVIDFLSQDNSYSDEYKSNHYPDEFFKSMTYPERLVWREMSETLNKRFTKK